MGLRNLSMRPASIGPVKHLIRRVDLQALRRVIDPEVAKGTERLTPESNISNAAVLPLTPKYFLKEVSGTNMNIAESYNKLKLESEYRLNE